MTVQLLTMPTSGRYSANVSETPRLCESFYGRLRYSQDAPGLVSTAPGRAVAVVASLKINYNKSIIYFQLNVIQEKYTR